ncbi:DUF397 domain-containing protein [Streptomyces sp. CA-243310]|uniref:DUF397 domain-containing protein n=1 Tax=Streptomyces sp. CA-243310 TaxID=3240056 RepID=UPI003D9064D7
MSTSHQREGTEAATASLGWYKSSHSSGDSGQCLEVAPTPGALYVRDSKACGRGPVLRFPVTAWTSFITDVRNDGAI